MTALRTLCSGVRQIAYFVPDIRHAALRHARDFGSGPFFIADHVKLRYCRHRGMEAPCDHSAADGQWGDLMVEFIHQNNPGPSAFHDLYAHGSGRGGMHHVAIFVDDIQAAIVEFATHGHAEAMYAEMESGFAFAMIDTVASLGHMVELYQPEPVLLDFYAMVKAAAKDSNSNEALLPISLD